MEASEATVDMASVEEPKVQQVTTHAEELELPLANMTVEGAFVCSCVVCLPVNETHQSFVATDRETIAP